MSIKDFCVMEMGNMGALERKVDVLLRYCTAQSESERRHCYADLKKIRNAQAVEEGYRQSIDRVLRELGIGDHLKGYAYLQTAIALALYSPQMVYNVMTVLYPAVAAEHKTSVGSVERSMRSAIESGWDRCGWRTQEKYFGSQLDPDRGKPANTLFIARVAKYIRNELQNTADCAIF